MLESEVYRDGLTPTILATCTGVPRIHILITCPSGRAATSFAASYQDRTIHEASTVKARRHRALVPDK